MAKGESGLGGATAKVKTPSGIDYDQFMKMSEDERYQVMDDIINNDKIVIPDYLDNSKTSKVLFGLGMDDKPKVVDDDELDKMPGEDLYRTVYDTPNPPPYAEDVLDQIRNGDFTQMSGSGGSYHGRAIYFAEGNYNESALYGFGESNPTMMRAKLTKKAKIVGEQDLMNEMGRDTNFVQKHGLGTDAYALYAISHGYDGWHDQYSGYTMVVSRKNMVASRQNKDIYGSDWKDADNK